MTALHHPEANHPDIGHLHVNSELHPDVGVVHEDEYDARMDQVPPYVHHSDQDYYYDEYYLVNRRGLNVKGSEETTQDHDMGRDDFDWIESHRVRDSSHTSTTASTEEIHSQAIVESDMWLEAHRVTSPSVQPSEVTDQVVDSELSSQDIQPAEKTLEEWIADHRVQQSADRVSSIDPLMVQTTTQYHVRKPDDTSYPPEKLAWLLHHQVSYPPDLHNITTAAESPDLDYLSDAADVFDSDMSVGAPDAYSGQLWDDWVNQHKVVTYEIDKDLVQRAEAPPAEAPPAEAPPAEAPPAEAPPAEAPPAEAPPAEAPPAEAPPAEAPPAEAPPAEASPADQPGDSEDSNRSTQGASNDELFDERKKIDQQMLVVSKDDNSKGTTVPTISDLTSDRVSDEVESNSTLHDAGEQAMNKAHHIMANIEENKVFSETEDETDVTEDGDGHQLLDQKDSQLNAEIEKLLSEKTHEQNKVANIIAQQEEEHEQKSESVKAGEHDVDLSHAADIDANVHVNDELNILNQELIDVKDELNQVENFDHEKLKSSHHDGVVLQSELDKLSTEIEKDEEKIAGLGLQAQKSAHDQGSDTNRDMVVNEEISELSDSIKQMATDIDDIENSERNSAKNLKSSADRTEHVIGAKLDKLESVLETNAEQIQKLEKEVEGDKQADNHAKPNDGVVQSEVKLDKHLEGHEEVISENINTVEDIATKVETGMSSLTKHLASMESSQQVGQQKLLNALTELSRTLVSSQSEHNKALQILASAQESLNSKVIEAQRREHKPLMVVIPDKQTDPPRHMADLQAAKDLIDNLEEETLELQHKEEKLVGAAVKQNEALRSLNEQTDNTVKSLLSSADVLKQQQAEEIKHDKEEEEKDEKIIANLKHNQHKENKDKGWTDWSAWSHCYGFGCKSIGKAQRYRVCQSHAGHCGGGNSWQSKSCRRRCSGFYKSSWSEWSSWSDCPVDCGPGISDRARTCEKAPCVGDSHESEPCSKGECIEIPPEQGPDIEAVAMADHGTVHSTQHVVTCEDSPCMNDGQCIQGGEGEGTSPFIHFHCECVHPYKGLMCDVSCDMDSKVNAIVIGILAGILVLVLLCAAWAGSYDLRKRYCRWKRHSDPVHSRKRGCCWERMFGCKPKCTCRRTGSDYSSSYTTCTQCSSVCDSSGRCSHCTESCDNLSVHDYFKSPYGGHHRRHSDDALGRNKTLKSLISITEPNPSMMHGSSGLLGHGSRKSIDKKGELSRKEGSSSALSKTTTGDAGSSDSDSGSDSNSNDNARDHTSTQLSVTRNRTNNQSEVKTDVGASRLKCSRDQNKMSTLSPIAEEPTKETIRGKTLLKPHRRGWPVRKYSSRKQYRDKSKQISHTKQCSHYNPKSKGQSRQSRQAAGTVDGHFPTTRNVALTEDIERNLTQFMDSCDQLDGATDVPARLQSSADPQLLERLKQVRRQHALALGSVPAMDGTGDGRDMTTDYPLVGSYMTQWRDFGRTPASFLQNESASNRKEDESSIDPAKPVTDLARDWRPITDNPVHSVWNNMTTTPIRQTPYNRQPTLNDSLSSNVDSLKSIRSNGDKRRQLHVGADVV